MIKRIRAYMINTRIKSLQRVRRNGIKEGWPTLVADTDEHISTQREKLAKLYE